LLIYDEHGFSSNHYFTTIFYTKLQRHHQVL
jgi:hypothetical protein